MWVRDLVFAISSAFIEQSFSPNVLSTGSLDSTLDIFEFEAHRVRDSRVCVTKMTSCQKSRCCEICGPTSSKSVKANSATHPKRRFADDVYKKLFTSWILLWLLSLELSCLMASLSFVEKAPRLRTCDNVASHPPNEAAHKNDLG